MNQYVTLDVDLAENEPVYTGKWVNLVVGDKGKGGHFRVSHENIAVDLTGYITELRATAADNKTAIVASDGITITNPENGEVDVLWPATFYDLHGTITDFRLIFKKGEDRLSTSKVWINIDPTPGMSEKLGSTIDEVHSYIQQALVQMAGIKEGYEKFTENAQSELYGLHEKIEKELTDQQSAMNVKIAELTEQGNAVAQALTDLQTEKETEINQVITQAQTNFAAKSEDLNVQINAKTTELDAVISTGVSNFATQIAELNEQISDKVKELANLKSTKEAELTTALADVVTKTNAKIADIQDQYNAWKAGADAGLVEYKETLKTDVDSLKSDIPHLQEQATAIEASFIDIENKVKELQESMNAIDLSNYYTKTDVDGLIANIHIPEIDLTPYVKQADLDTGMALKADKAELDQLTEAISTNAIAIDKQKVMVNDNTKAIETNIDAINTNTSVLAIVNKTVNNKVDNSKIGDLGHLTVAEAIEAGGKVKGISVNGTDVTLDDNGIAPVKAITSINNIDGSQLEITNGSVTLPQLIVSGTQAEIDLITYKKEGVLYAVIE